MASYDAADITSRLGRPATKPNSTTIPLSAGDKAWNPASTKHDITGPATVTYTAYPDGGINAQVERR